MRSASTPPYWMTDATLLELSSSSNRQSQSKWVLPAIVSTLVLFGLNIISPASATWAALVFFLLGVPHGAVERTPDRPRFIMPTLGYTALYIVFGIVVFSSWLISPLGTLVLFLALSAWHFGEAEPNVKSLGLWVILGSFLVYPAETVNIFAFLIGQNVPADFGLFAYQLAAAAALLLICGEYIFRVRLGGRPSTLRLVFLAVLFFVLSPICAVAVYFFAFHGMGEFSRTIAAVSRANGPASFADILKLYGPATFPAMIGAVVILTLTYQGYLPVLFASGLAVAFIIPHMLPVEKLLRVDRDAARYLGNV